MIKMPISEIADRLSIAVLKNRRTDNNMDAEIKTYLTEIDGYPLKDRLFINGMYHRLLVINGKIWDLESDIRSGKEGELGLEEVGRRAIRIRELNRQRVAIKNEIVEKLGEGFKDIKINHASE